MEKHSEKELNQRGTLGLIDLFDMTIHMLGGQFKDRLTIISILG